MKSKPKVIEQLLLLFGFLFLIFGLIHFKAFANSLVKINLFDALFNSLLGVGSFFSYYLLKKKNKSVCILIGSIAILVLIYPLLIGRKFGQNIIFLAGVGWLLYNLTILNKTKYLH